MTRYAFLATAALVGAVAGAPSVYAQGSRTSPVLLEPLDWGPNAAWRRRAGRVRAERLQWLRQGDLGSLNAAGANRPGGPLRVLGGALQSAVLGAFHVPVVVIAYRDRNVQYPVAQFQCLLFSRLPMVCGNPGDRPYSVTTYYEELSQHRITLDGTVLPVARMDSNAAFYTDGCNGFSIAGRTTCPARPINRMALMMVAALDSVSLRPGGDTLWSQFDNDGSDGVPNSGDDDGVVDFVDFLQPEIGGECVRLDPPPTGVWSHRFIIAGWMGGVPASARPANVGPDGMYITRTPRRGPTGQPIVVGGQIQYIRVNDYTIQSQLGGATACDAATIMGIGTIAHETGHAFGLPDLYDTSGGTQGIGGWGLMGSGNYARPYSPSSFDPWSLLVLGWATVDTLGSSRTVTTGPRLLTDTIFYARTDNPDDFLLVEHRAAVRSDTAQMNPALPDGCPPPLGSSIGGLGFCAKSPGLLLWLINQPKVTGATPGNSVNTGQVHGVALLQADGLNQLRVPGSNNRGDRGDAFPGSTGNPRFGLLGAPSARSNTGEFIGFILDRIGPLPGGSISFRFTRRKPSLIAVTGGALIRVKPPQLRQKMREILSAYPVQPEAQHRKRITKFMGLKIITLRPVMQMIYRYYNSKGLNYEDSLANKVRDVAAPAGDKTVPRNANAKIRFQPSATMLWLMNRRLARFELRQIDERRRKGETLTKLLGDAVVLPAQANAHHDYWVYPLLVSNPEKFIDALRAEGFDAAGLPRSQHIAEPADRPELKPVTAAAVMRDLIVVPCYDTMPDREIERLAAVVKKVAATVPARKEQ